MQIVDLLTAFMTSTSKLQTISCWAIWKRETAGQDNSFSLYQQRQIAFVDVSPAVYIKRKGYLPYWMVGLPEVQHSQKSKVKLLSGFPSDILQCRGWFRAAFRRVANTGMMGQWDKLLCDLHNCLLCVPFSGNYFSYLKSKR